MRICDPHIHMYSRITDDYQKMYLCGVRVVVEPAFWLGQPRTHPATFFDYFDAIIEWETTRAANHGILHFTCIAVNPRESNRRELAAEVIAGLEIYLDKPGVVCLGEIGFDSITAAEEESMRAQLEIAKRRGLPVMIHTPHQDKASGTARSLAIVAEMGMNPDLVLIDHNTEETIEMVKESGCWAGHTVYSVTKLSPERAASIFERYGVERMLVNSAADWGPSDPLNVPKTMREMELRGFTQEEIARVVWTNPIEFFSQSGKMDLSGLGA